MDNTQVVTLMLAPTLVPIVWWILTRPGKRVLRYLYAKLPEGRLRRLLLRKVSDNWLPPFVKDDP